MPAKELVRLAMVSSPSMSCGEVRQASVDCVMSDAKLKCDDNVSAKNPYNVNVKHNEGGLSRSTEHVASKPHVRAVPRSKPTSTSTFRLR